MCKKFNYVYITTNLINNKQYIGSHCTDNIDDNYIGSGRVFLKAVKKYGKENFIREILEMCEDPSTARYKEEFYINEYLTLDPSGYNISPKGGLGFKGATISESQRKKMSEWQKGRTYEELYGPEKAAEMKRKQSKSKKGKSTSRKGKGHKKQLIEKYGKMEGEKRYNEMIQKQRISHIGKTQSEETIKRKIKSMGDVWNKNKKYKLGPYSEERKQKFKVPHKTKQKQLLEDLSIINYIKELRFQRNSYKFITEKTGINYHLLKTII